MKYIVVLLAFLILTGMSCKNGKNLGSDTQSSAGEPVKWEKVSEDLYSGVETESYQLIQDTQSWQELWKKLSSNRIPAPPAPKVDFEQHSLIACMMGTRPNGGFSIAIKSLTREGQSLQLLVEHRGPGKGCFNTEALTQPYFIATIPRTEAALSVSKDVKLIDCE